MELDYVFLYYIRKEEHTPVVEEDIYEQEKASRFFYDRHNEKRHGGMLWK